MKQDENDRKYQVLARIRCSNAHMLPVEVLIGTTILETHLAVSMKAQHMHTP